MTRDSEASPTPKPLGYMVEDTRGTLQRFVWEDRRFEPSVTPTVFLAREQAARAIEDTASLWDHVSPLDERTGAPKPESALAGLWKRSCLYRILAVEGSLA